MKNTKTIIICLLLIILTASASTIAIQKVTIIQPSKPKSQKIIYLYFDDIEDPNEVIRSRIYPLLKEGYIINSMAGTRNSNTYYLVKY